jgi:transcriptional regulator with XRE-family HTH domain
VLREASQQEPNTVPLPRTPEAFREWLSDLRSLSGLTHDELAEAVGGKTDRRQTIRWLKEGTEPGALALLKILTALGATIEPPPPGGLRAVNAELTEIRDRLDCLMALDLERVAALVTRLENVLDALSTSGLIPAEPPRPERVG